MHPSIMSLAPGFGKYPEPLFNNRLIFGDVRSCLYTCSVNTFHQNRAYLGLRIQELAELYRHFEKPIGKLVCPKSSWTWSIQ